MNKWKIIVPILVIAVLACAFWYGGSAPGMQGWNVGESVAEADVTPEISPEITTEPTPEITPEPTEEISPEPTVEPTPEISPEVTPEITAEPTPEVSTEPTPEPTPEVTAEPENTEEPASEMAINPETGKDKYMTDPVPEGKPLPVEPENVTISDTLMACTLSVRCDTILNHMDWLTEDKEGLVPEDGVIFEAQTVYFYEGESVFNVLQREMKRNKIHMEFEHTPMYNSAYIEGINNIYEFDVGELSGWMYKVNDWFPNYGCSRYVLQDGDVIEWVFTCDLGYDVGGGFVTGQ